MAMRNDESIVNRIIDQKTRNQEFKEHPDAPGDINAMLFYVLVDLESVAEDEHAERVEVEVGGDAFGSEAPYLICMSFFLNFKYQFLGWSFNTSIFCWHLGWKIGHAWDLECFWG